MTWFTSQVYFIQKKAQCMAQRIGIDMNLCAEGGLTETRSVFGLPLFFLDTPAAKGCARIRQQPIRIWVIAKTE